MAVPTGIGENRVLAAVLDTDITEVIQCQLLNEVMIERPLLVPIQHGRLHGLHLITPLHGNNVIGCTPTRSKVYALQQGFRDLAHLPPLAVIPNHFGPHRE